MARDRIAIIGAGFAGMTAAVHLSSKNREILIFDSAKQLGGRAFSFRDKKTDLILDNGQHLFMGCYAEMLSFLKRIGADKKLHFEKPSSIAYKTERDGIYKLKAARLLAPFHLAKSLLLDLKPLNFTDRLRIVYLAASLIVPASQKLKSITIRTWLIQQKQNDKTINYVWNIVAESILNASIDILNAYTFKQTLKILFIHSAKNIQPILSKVGLTELLNDHFFAFMQKNGNQIHLNSLIKDIDQLENKFVLKSKNNEFTVDKVVLAQPYNYAKKLVALPEISFKTSSILSIHFTLDEGIFEEAFLGFPEGKIHWIFNKKKFSTSKNNIYSAVISTADKYITQSTSQIEELLKTELHRFFPNNSFETLDNIKIVHEKRATVVFSCEFIKNTIKPSEIEKNIFVCGDWTDTGLPATIESACKSGKIISQIIH